MNSVSDEITMFLNEMKYRKERRVGRSDGEEGATGKKERRKMKDEKVALGRIVDHLGLVIQNKSVYALFALNGNCFCHSRDQFGKMIRRNYG